MVVGVEINAGEVVPWKNAETKFRFAGYGEGEGGYAPIGRGDFIRSGDGFEGKDWRPGIRREGAMVLVIGPGVACEEEGKGGEQDRPGGGGGVGEHFLEFQI